jgi:hypothetical protein
VKRLAELLSRLVSLYLENSLLDLYLHNSSEYDGCGLVGREDGCTFVSSSSWRRCASSFSSSVSVSWTDVCDRSRCLSPSCSLSWRDTDSERESSYLELKLACLLLESLAGTDSSLSENP